MLASMEHVASPSCCFIRNENDQRVAWCKSLRLLGKCTYWSELIIRLHGFLVPGFVDSGIKCFTGICMGEKLAFQHPFASPKWANRATKEDVCSGHS
eukprot:1153787-Pelagomonas_calceolata.AAC.5